MQAIKIVIWQEEDAWVGYLQDYPDYWTQGVSLDDLKEHLKDLYADLSAELIPGARRVEDLLLS
jgi:predicted RNase H-like HicB family nuclease